MEPISNQITWLRSRRKVWRKIRWWGHSL